MILKDLGTDSLRPKIVCRSGCATLDPYAEYLSIGASRRVFDGAIYVLADIRPTRNGADHAAEQWRKQGRYARVTSTGSQRFTAYRGKPAFAVWVR